MNFRLAKLRFRRVFRRHRRQLLDAGLHADEHLTRHFFRRLHHLISVKWFLMAWLIPVLALICLSGWQALALSGYYKHLVPASGGIYREGIIGQFTDANPIYATSDVDKSVSELIFAGLFKYNSKDQLVGDLAQGYKASDGGRIYTVRLRPNLTWQDGAPLTSADVQFTYQTIQNPQAQSPYLASWQGVTVSTNGPMTVIFILPNPLASFKYSLTNGIVPKHILGNISPGQLRSSNFNTDKPVGAGPFTWDGLSVEGSEPEVRQEIIALKPFAGYHSGEAELGGLVLHAYPTAQLASQDLLAGNIDGLAGLEDIPNSFKGAGFSVYSIPLMAETDVFFKESSPALKDGSVRQALILAANRSQVISGLHDGAKPVGEPLISGQLGYDAKYLQPKFDLVAAKELLNKDGWKPYHNGELIKGGQVLVFSLYALNNPPYRAVANALKNQWQALGVKVDVYFEDQADFQSSLSSHDYDAILDDISLGTDPDEYIYWDSSQADVRSASRLNLSEVRDSAIDIPLEAGRTRDNVALRTVKYHKFLAAWLENEPALILYQPRFLYITRGNLYNFASAGPINSAVGRYNNVANWEVRQSDVID